MDKCHKHLMKLVKELNENSFVMEVPIFKQFHKFVIGKGGANIRKVGGKDNLHSDLFRYPLSFMVFIKAQKNRLRFLLSQ